MNHVLEREGGRKFEEEGVREQRIERARERGREGEGGGERERQHLRSEASSNWCLLTGNKTARNQCQFPVRAVQSAPGTRLKAFDFAAQADSSMRWTQHVGREHRMARA
eukprot:3902617-Rhodomonas_salina.1